MNSDTQWVFPVFDPGKYEIRCLVALALNIGIRTSFGLATYRFGGKLYHQLKGGPIGSRLTMVCARLLMIFWDSRVMNKLKQADLDVWMRGGYVDDLRFILSLLQPGWRWNNNKRKFEWDEELSAADTKAEMEADLRYYGDCTVQSTVHVPAGLGETDAVEIEKVRTDEDEPPIEMDSLCPLDLAESLDEVRLDELEKHVEAQVEDMDRVHVTTSSTSSTTRVL